MAKDKFTDTAFIFLLVEAVLCLVGTVLMTQYYDIIYYTIRSHDFIMIPVVGYLLITLIFIIAYVADYDSKFLIFMTGGVLNLVAGILMIMAYSDTVKFLRTTNTIILAFTTIVCGVVMIVDSILCGTGTFLMIYKYDFIYYYKDGSRDFITVAVMGYLLITLVFLIAYIGQHDEKFMVLLAGGLVNLAAGVWMIMSYADTLVFLRTYCALIIAGTTTACGFFMVVDSIKNMFGPLLPQKQPV